jgi:quercetin dioxygenase-like cupin family protein
MSETGEDQGPVIGVTRRGEVPADGYGAAQIQYLVSERTNGARELTLAAVGLPVGGSNPVHKHPNCEEALYVLSGEIEHYIEGTERVRMGAGDAILIPRGLWHQAVNVGDTPVELLVSFSHPARESVLKE